MTIVGPNGAGKSTLIRAVIGLLKPWSGRVLLRGDDVTGRKPHSLVARGIGYVAQRDNVFATMPVEENLELGALTLRQGRARTVSRRCTTCFLACRRGASSLRARFGGRAPDASARASAHG